MFSGDFNGDGRDDMICVSASGGAEVATAAESETEFHRETWKDEDFGFCTSGKVKLFSID